MTPAPFSYLRAESTEEALCALAQYGDDVAVLAGGQSLVPMLAMRLARPAMIVDIGRLTDLADVTSEGSTMCLGALVRHRHIEKDSGLARHLPLFSEAAKWVATPAVRNAGTIGGALALGDPAAEYPAVAMALGARIRLASVRGERMLDACAFFLGGMETAVLEDELLLGVEVATAAQGDAFGFCEIAERRGDYALAGAAMARRADGVVTVGLFGAGDATCFAEGAAAILSATEPGSWTARILDDVKDAVIQDLGDVALDQMRARLAGVAVVRAARQIADPAPRLRSAT